MISPFTTHKGDHASEFSKIPFGLRIDLKRLCELLPLTSQYSFNKHEIEAKYMVGHPLFDLSFEKSETF